MHKRAHKTQGHVCECLCEGSLLKQPNSTKPYVFSGPRSLREGKNEKKLSETLSPVSNCHCQKQLLESNSESYEKNVIFLRVSCPSSNTKRAPDLQTPLLHEKLSFSQKTVCFHAAHSMWNSFKHKQALFKLKEWRFMLLSGPKRTYLRFVFPWAQSGKRIILSMTLYFD